VTGIELDGQKVLVKFTVDKNIRLGDRTEAAIKTKGLLGTKILEVYSRGEGQQEGTIPLDRTTSPYQLPDALGELAATISGLNTNQLSESLRTLSETFADTPPDLRIAVEGVARFSDTLNARDAELRGLLENADKATTVLAERSNQIVGLVSNTNALLAELQSGRISALLDVTDPNEPLPIDSPFFKLSNCIVLPHIAAVTREARLRQSAITLAEVQRFLANQALQHQVTLARWETMA